MPARCWRSPARRSTCSSPRPAIDAGVGGFGFFEFALAGIPLLAGSIVIIVLFGRCLLPERNGATMPADFSRHAKTLVEQYGLASGVFQAARARHLALCRRGPRRASTSPPSPASS